MKKFLTFVLALAMVCSLSVTAFAEGGTTTLTANIPNAAEPSYTLHIPANTTLTYGSTEKQKISGGLYVENVQNASRVYFLAPFTDLINTSDSSDSIALNLYVDELDSGDLRHTVNQTTGKVDDATWKLYDIDWPEFLGKYATETFYAQVTDWSGATPGATYQAVITFTVWAE